ncbi:TonB-dependent receptor [Aurantiacibacter spongiae]|uniref:TonB-dependent receptor n=1 Tax=Aurantiacibacter spongiae TaxID=2488860 RepID=A0A3N5CW68_9SPHN|nr:hypothetical protein [Aurantiacibacter spongiae]RPF70869.1 hypothetical protein EG799_03955 [Aurantiacibacter spongiae]
MSRISSTSLIAITLTLCAHPALAQDAPPPEQETPEDSAPPADDENVIVVYGARLLGEVETAEPPILELGEDDIAAYGAGSIGELLESLGPQVSSGRGRGGGGQPVFLVNGQRIASFRELRSYPPEAIEKVEVFNEEVAQRYGYSPDQRVVNFILKDDFSSQEIEVEYSQPFRGGYSRQEVEGTYLRIDGTDRLNINLDWNNSSLLTEAERGIVQTAANTPDIATDPDPARFRSLVADSAGVEATVNYSMGIGDSGDSLSLNATYERDDSLRLQGLDLVTLTGPDGIGVRRSFNPAFPLTFDASSDTYAAAATLNFGLGDWEMTGTLDLTRAISDSVIASRYDTADLEAAAMAGDLPPDADLADVIGGDFVRGFDRARTKTWTTNALVTARGNPIYLPAGDVSVTLDAGYRWNRIEGSDTRTDTGDTRFTRGRVSGGANVTVPLTSRDLEFGGFLGDLTLNLNAGLDEVSDFGTLYNWTLGLTWGLTDKLTLTVSSINSREAPTLSQLGSPTLVTPNVPVFDFVNNETVLAEVTSGGNGDLPAQKQGDFKASLVWDLPVFDRSNLNINYFDNHSDNVIAGFPLLTPAIEAAFPGRVTRAADGTLRALDNRFVSFAAQDQRSIQVGLNLSDSFGGADESEGEDQRGGGERRGGPRAGGPAGGAVGGGGEGRPDPARMAAMREQFCNTEPDILIERFNQALAAEAAGEEPPVGPDGEPLNIPPQLLERLKGEDGKVDPERFGAFRERICNAPQGQAQGEGGNRGGGRRGGGGGGGRGFGRFGGGNDDGPPEGRWFAGFDYTYAIDNTILIAPGVPVLDLLDGDALSGGSNPRHSASARAGVFYDGWGGFLFGRYTGASTISGTGLPGSTDLRFDDYATLNLRLFANLGERDSLVEKYGFLEGTRISFGIDNIFDTRQRVTDSNGETPLRYQPFLIDPTGRSFEIEFRKLF